MKKTLLILLLALTAAETSAQRYRESFGVVVGTLDGITYKCHGKQSEHFVFEFDAYWQWGYMPEGTRYDYTIAGNMRYYSEQTYISDFPQARYQAAMTSFSFMYEGEIATNARGAWNWYVGGGFGLGMSWGFDMDDISHEFRPNRGFNPWLKLDQHAIGGVEYSLAAVPLAIGMDLRPALVENMVTKGLGVNRTDLYMTAFDWGVNMTLRYCFGK